MDHNIFYVFFTCMEVFFNNLNVHEMQGNAWNYLKMEKMQEWWNKIQKCMVHDLNGPKYFLFIFCMKKNIFNNDKYAWNAI